MTLEGLMEGEAQILLEAISGSKAYGTAIEGSDTDRKGVFILPKAVFYGMDYCPQVADATNDTVFYELGRFTELLSKSNPNMLELLAVPDDCLLSRHPLIEYYTPALFLSKECCQAFGGYAMTQVKKARGLNKKIVNPMEKERKPLLDFCYILHEGNKSMPVTAFLQSKGWQQEQCGLASIPHFKNTYALYHDPADEIGFKGIVRKESSNEVSTSSIPKGLRAVATLYFNKEGYQVYCKHYQSYWSWVEKRNELRYQNTLAHGKLYDAKNMMHTFRLLDMAEEIAREGLIRVRRPNRDFLLAIRRGDFEYEQLLKWAQEKMARIEELFADAPLPDVPPREKIQRVLVEARNAFYHIGD
jgi:hypothetical protein